MNFLSKQVRNKIIAQALVATSVLGVGINFDLITGNILKVSAIDGISNTSTGLNITNIESGHGYNVFSKSDGTFWGFGNNGNG